MSDIEVLNTYRVTMLELRMLNRQMDMCLSAGTPRAARAPLGEAPRGTNHHQAARQQHYDGMEAIWRRKQAELEEVASRFEEILDGVRQVKLRLILRSYYGLGMTDEAIAAEMGMTARRINDLRNQFLRSLVVAEAA